MKIKNTAKKVVRVAKMVAKAPVKFVVKTAEDALKTTRNLNKQNAQRAIDAVNKNKRPY